MVRSRCLVWLIACVCALRAAGGEMAEPGPVDHDAFDRILQATVHDGRVDYLLLRRDHRDELTAYLDSLARVDPQPLARAERLAFHINLYNATVLDGVVRRLHHGYRVSDDDFALFDEPLVRLQGRTLTLNALENDIIRPGYHDPRVHAALVCAARSCPPLRAHAYLGPQIDSVLEQQMRSFLADPARNQVDRASGVLRLSAIFQWYAADFGGSAGVARWVSRYLTPTVAAYRVEHLEYSWALNIAPPGQGTWVAVKEARAPFRATAGSGGQPDGHLEAGSIVEVLARQGDQLQVNRPRGRGAVWISASQTSPFEL